MKSITTGFATLFSKVVLPHFFQKWFCHTFFKSVFFKSVYMSELPILIVFDIDETLIQFMNRSAYHFWKDADPVLKRSLTEHCEYIDIDTPDKEACIIFRTGLRKFLEEVKRNERLKIAIWTYSNKDYATYIAESITEHFGFDENPFLFAYGDEDIKDHDTPKSLQQIWDDPEFGETFNKFNTFLVDDRKGNICHDINMYNGIIIQAFAPFGETKSREPLTQASLEKSINDDVFEHLSKISNKILKDIDGCTEEDIEEALTVESIFLPKCMRRRKLQEYFKEYEYDGDSINICTIGEVKNAASKFKGGKTKTLRKTNKKIKTNRKTNKKNKRKTIKKRKRLNKKKSYYKK